jgi:membrane protease YdiL (CAAX protease family)
VAADAQVTERRAQREEPVPAGKLVAWTVLVTSLIVLAYVANAASPDPPDEDILYRYSTAIAATVQYALMLGVVGAISRGLSRETLGFRSPASWPRALGLTLGGLAAIWAAGVVLNVFLKAGDEQGLVPDDWDSGRAGAFVANFVVIAIVAPIVEETTYRGLGFAAVRSSFGPLAAILATSSPCESPNAIPVTRIAARGPNEERTAAKPSPR